MTSRESDRLIVALVFSCVLSAVHAQGLVGDPTLTDMAAKMKPGQSMVRGNTKLTLNQRDAGTQDAQGWFLAQSAKGGFSVRFPGPINDETMVTKDRGSQIEVNMLTTRTPAANFMVFCTKESGHEFSIDGGPAYPARQLEPRQRTSRPKHSRPALCQASSTAASTAQEPTLAWPNVPPKQSTLSVPDWFCTYVSEAITPEIRTALDSFQSVN